jgi:non-heme chloroperoxidase
VAGAGVRCAALPGSDGQPEPPDRARVDSKNPDRGPLLIISGEKDNTAPWAIANASYKRQKRNQGVTEIIKMPNRGHGVVIDSDWREVADAALAFVKCKTQLQQ